MNKIISTIISLIIISSLTLSTYSCYSLKGISISPEVKTYYVDNFRNTTANAPSDIHLKFSETLRSKIRNETRLTNQEIDSDLIFEGEVTSYSITAEAASGENSSAFNKLKITVKVSLTDNNEEKNSWEQSFSFYKNFGTDQSIQELKDEFIKEIFEQITEDIFNKAFTNW